MSWAGFYAAGQVEAGGLLLADSGIVGTERLYFSSHGYLSRPTDAEPNRYYPPAAVQPLLLRRSVVGGDTPVGSFGPGFAEIEILNADGALDQTLARAGFAGHPVAVKAVARAAGVPQPLDGAQILFRGVTERVTQDLDRVRLGAATLGLQLDSPLEDGSFAGTGGLEGGADLAGKRYPTALGFAAGISPPYLGVVGGLHAYRVAGGDGLPIQDVPAFYDKGEALAKVGGAPGSGEYSVDTATGLVQIGGASAATFPTCDVEGYAPGGSFKQTTADIIQAVIEDFGQATGIVLDGYALAVMNADQPAIVGAWYGPDNTATRGQAIAEFLRGAMAWGGVDRQGVFDLGVLKAPSGAVRMILDQGNVFEAVPVPGPAIVNPPPWRVEVGYGFNPSVTSDVSPAAGDAQRQFMAERWRLGVAAKPAVKARHLSSETFFVPGLFKSKADAEALAARLLSLFETARVVTLRTGMTSPQLDIGQPVEIRLPRFNLDGRIGTILGYAVNVAAGTTDLEVFV